MTKDKAFKMRVRALMAETGSTYMQAYKQLMKHGDVPGDRTPDGKRIADESVVRVARPQPLERPDGASAEARRNLWRAFAKANPDAEDES